MYKPTLTQLKPNHNWILDSGVNVLYFEHPSSISTTCLWLKSGTKSKHNPGDECVCFRKVITI